MKHTCHPEHEGQQIDDQQHCHNQQKHKTGTGCIYNIVRLCLAVSAQAGQQARERKPHTHG